MPSPWSQPSRCSLAEFSGLCTIKCTRALKLSRLRLAGLPVRGTELTRYINATTGPGPAARRHDLAQASAETPSASRNQPADASAAARHGVRSDRASWPDSSGGPGRVLRQSIKFEALGHDSGSEIQIANVRARPGRAGTMTFRTLKFQHRWSRPVFLW